MWDLSLQPDELRAAERALAPLDGAPFTAISLGGKVINTYYKEVNLTMEALAPRSSFSAMK